jgi:hypothetical protein
MASPFSLLELLSNYQFNKISHDWEQDGDKFKNTNRTFEWIMYYSTFYIFLYSYISDE